MEFLLSLDASPALGYCVFLSWQQVSSFPHTSSHYSNQIATLLFLDNVYAVIAVVAQSDGYQELVCNVGVGIELHCSVV